MRPRLDAPVRRLRMLPPDVIVRAGSGGRLYARSPHPLGPYPDTLTERLDHWAGQAPNRTFLASRDASGGWRRLTYAAALDETRRVAQALLNRGLSANRPMVILSGNSLEHAVLALAAMYIGVPYAPIAPAYSILSHDHGTLRFLWSVMRPGLVFADDADTFSRALASLPRDHGAEIVSCPHGSNGSDGRQTAFASLVDTPVTPAVDDAHRRVGPDTVAKVLFTSGSTGAPKGVINTQRMLSANQEQLRAVMAFLADEPPVLCDWLPWNHTFGGNHNFGLTLYNGGTMYLDAGTPTPASFSTTLANLRAIQTTAYFNVPRGYELLLPALRADPAFCRHFFGRLSMLFYAAAGLRQEIVDAFDALSSATLGERLPWVTGLGATETAPFAMCTGAMPVPVAGRIGVPVPGVDLKVEPVGDVLEARLKGPNITPGYWRDPALTSESFDAEGYYRMGDAVRPVDPGDVSQGFEFRGRLAEDFKLATGTWVRVGPLRAALLAQLGDLAHDVVIAGPDRADVRILVFPNLETCAGLARRAPSPQPRDVLAQAAVRHAFRLALERFSAGETGSSTRVVCAMLLDSPPSIDAGEATDKGSLNQKAVLRHRHALVDQMYEAPDSDDMIISVDGGSET